MSECGKMESSLEMRFEIAGLSLPPSSICSHHLTLKALKSFTRDIAWEWEVRNRLCGHRSGQECNFRELRNINSFGRVHATSDTNAFLKGRREGRRRVKVN